MAGPFRQLKSMALSDDEQLDWLQKMGAWPRAAGSDVEPPEYPSGLMFTVCEPDFAALGIDQVKPGATVRFAAFARCCAANRQEDTCRVEAEIDFLSLGERPMAELECRPCVCLDQNDHERLDLDEACERGDMLHLIGTAKVKGTDDPRFGGRSITLQIIEADVEDEDAEAEEAA